MGVHRLDYTKGIRHRIKAYGELVQEARMPVGEAILVQVASHSRERLRVHQELRDEVESAVGRVNLEVGGLGRPRIADQHHHSPMEEMAAIYNAADVMLVTSLRDGMNLVAKEYVAARVNDDGVLVLSEFTGAADELQGAVLVNPHDIEGLKD